jgi:hypothetical protein
VIYIPEEKAAEIEACSRANFLEIAVVANTHCCFS